MPLHADLYVDRIDVTRHLGNETCSVCQVDSLEMLVDRLRSGRLCQGRCPHWPPERVEAFRLAIDAGEVLPAIPSLTVPRPAASGPFALNEPNGASPVLVTGNSQLTHEVLLAVLSTLTGPMWMLAVDTDGHTVDMSLVYQTLTPKRVAAALDAGDPEGRTFDGRVLLPGLAEPLVAPVSSLLGRSVEAGPICAAELPLVLAQQKEKGGEDPI